MEFLRDPRIGVPIIAGGAAFIVVKMAVNLWSWSLASIGFGLIAGLVAAGIAYGVVLAMNRD